MTQAFHHREGTSPPDTGSREARSPGEAWPALPLDSWRDTYATLHMCSQIVGKTRLALAPRMNHWWHSTLYVTPRGLTTSSMPCGERALEVRFDFVDHAVSLETSDGTTRRMALSPRPVAQFYREYMALLASLDVTVRIWPVPVEIPNVIPFAEDSSHTAYDPEAARRFSLALVQVDRVLKEFRGRFSGKCSPVHFFWGAFDLACTRFSGRRAPVHPGGVPNCPDYVPREAYSHECMSVGFWPGGSGVEEAAFYSYAYPEPRGFSTAAIKPSSASYYHPTLREFVLPYDAVRKATDPDAMLLEFFQTTYDTAAELGEWDRALQMT